MIIHTSAQKAKRFQRYLNILFLANHIYGKKNYSGLCPQPRFRGWRPRV